VTTLVTSIRDGILEELLARLKALPGYHVERRARGEGDANHRKMALLLGGDENVQGVNNVLTTKEMTVEVLVQVRAEDAPAELAKNAERYLDAEMAIVERALFTPLWLTNREQLEPLGVFLRIDPDSNLMRGVIQLSVVYRHNNGDPTKFDGSFAG